MTDPQPDLQRCARRLWQAVEPLHAIAYFHPEPVRALQQLGLRGFWMSYFAGRFSPLGQPPAGTVTALAYVFAPTRVERAVPDAWRFADPDQITRTWIHAAAHALRQSLPSDAERRLGQLAPLLWQPVERCHLDGRPLAAAWADIDRPDDPFASTWLAATILREHRGDGHVLAAVHAGLTGIDAAITHAATGAIPPTSPEHSRGWTRQQLETSIRQLTDRGLLSPTGEITEAGQMLRARIENDTDRLASTDLQALGSARIEEIIAISIPLSRHLYDTRTVPLHNPIGTHRP